MTEPTATLSIDRSGLPGAPSPLVIAGDFSTTLGLVSLKTPGKVARIKYAPDSDYFAGSEALARTYQQGLISCEVQPDVASEAALRTAVADLEAALGQFRYTVTITINGVADVWTCDTASIEPPERDYVDLRDFDPVYTVTIPCKPIPA
jgi:hypothetical protein